MSCDPATLIDQAKCIECGIPNGMQLPVLIALICKAVDAQPLVYEALLNQLGATAPVATVLKNTLGGTPVWSYTDVGDYLMTLTGAFPAAKTVVYLNAAPNLDDPIAQVVAARVNNNSIRLVSYDDISVPSPFNGKLANTSILIKVYP